MEKVEDFLEAIVGMPGLARALEDAIEEEIAEGIEEALVAMTWDEFKRAQGKVMAFRAWKARMAGLRMNGKGRRI